MLRLCDEILRRLLPQLDVVVVEAVKVETDVVAVTARTRAGPVASPGCGRRSSWEHSRYVRRLGDEAVGGRAVRIDLSVRRLYCENTACPKVTFVEQVGGLTARYQRRTPALRRVVEAVAVALAGGAGARLLAHLHQTLSQLLLRPPAPEAQLPQQSPEPCSQARPASTSDHGTGVFGITPIAQTLRAARTETPDERQINVMGKAEAPGQDGPCQYSSAWPPERAVWVTGVPMATAIGSRPPYVVALRGAKWSAADHGLRGNDKTLEGS